MIVKLLVVTSYSDYYTDVYCLSCLFLIAQNLSVIQRLCNVTVHAVADVFGGHSEIFAFSRT